ncbi:hypothetical protein SLEP1_g24406 [Rubroshorea leprosula]|uniref:Uncharacterized protein n=1 Tax=Rubroshorea leprosula TaxID=152421 RepID=A0AAV5JLX1_9ROSI|nr:hypothetical protein SLEP1_g24406 [Rubroshorea leprosula]
MVSLLRLGECLHPSMFMVLFYVYGYVSGCLSFFFKSSLNPSFLPSKIQHDGFHGKSLLLGQNLAAKKAVKMEAYVSPTMGDVKERKAGFKEKVFMFVSKINPKGKSWLMKWETEHKKLSFMFDGGATKTKHKITT